MIRLLDEENNKKESLVSSYSEYSDRLINLGNSHYYDEMSGVNEEDYKNYYKKPSEKDLFYNKDFTKKIKL